MPLNWNDSTVPGWQTMWQLTPVGIASADRSAHDINEGLREMARLSHSRTEGMLNRKAQKDAQKRQEKQQKSMFKRQVGTQLAIGAGTAALTAGVGALAAPAMAAGTAAAGTGLAAGATTAGEAAALTSASALTPVVEGVGAGTLSAGATEAAVGAGAGALSAPVAESAAGGLSPIVGTADDMGIPSLVPSETGATYSLGDFAGGASSGSSGGIPTLTPMTPDAHTSAVGNNLANTRSQLRGQMGTGVGGDTTGLGAPQAGDFWSRFGKNFGMNMLGQSPYWAMMGGR